MTPSVRMSGEKRRTFGPQLRRASIVLESSQDLGAVAAGPRVSSHSRRIEGEISTHLEAALNGQDEESDSCASVVSRREGDVVDREYEQRADS